MNRFRQIYNLRDADAKGRLCVLIFTVIEGFLVYVTTGIFFTQFLQNNHIDINGAGILTFVLYLANMFVIFTPGLLNRFPKRRWLLAGCKFMYLFLIIVGITLLPHLVSDQTGQLWGMILLTFFANLFNVVATAGYAAWHIRFQPEEVRAYHLSVSLFATALVAGVFSLVGGWMCDTLPSFFIELFRYFAFGLGMVEVIFLLLPREVEYPVIRTPRFADIFSIPLRNKKFMLTMVVVFLWQFSLVCYSSQLNYYLLETIGMSNVFFNVIIFLYAPFFFLFMRFWQRRIRRTSWFSTFAVALLVVAPLQIVYGFVQPGPWSYIPLVLLVRLPQHFAGVGHNVAFANFQYINMPLTNRDCYTSFYQIVFNLGSVAGTLFGTVFTARMQDFSFSAFGYTYTTGTPLLTMLCGVIQFVIVAYILIFRKQLEPDVHEERA